MLAACACLIPMCGAAIAHAIPAQPSGWRLANADAPVAPDGVLLLVFEPGDLNDFSEPDPTLVDGSNVQVPGAIEPIAAEGSGNSLRIFRPTAALNGTSPYFLSGGTVVSDSGFTLAVTPLSDAMPSVAIEVEQDISLETLLQSCCMPSAIDFPGQVSVCIAVRSRERPLVRIRTTAGATDSDARQFVYRAQITGTSTIGRWLSAGDAALGWHLIPESADEYCYRVEAHRLTDGEEFVLEEGCVAASHGPLGERAPMESELRAQLLVHNCSAPSEPLEAAWCEVNRQPCADPINESVCAVAPFEEVCAGSSSGGKSLVDLVEEGLAADGQAGTSGGGSGGSSGAGGSGGAAGASGSNSAGSGAGGVGGADTTGGAGGKSSGGSDGTPPRSSSGCSALPRLAHASASVAASFASLLVLALLRARRRGRLGIEAHSQSR